VLDSAKKIWFYLITFLFIAINGVLLYSENYLFILFPAVLFIAYLGLFKLDVLYFIVVLLIPLSVNFDSLGSGMGLGMTLPTEPLIAGMMLIFVVKLFFSGSFDTKIAKHPVTILIIAHLVWLLITAITSESPLVSFKYFLSRFWFVSVFYFIASQVFQSKNNSSKLFWMYIAGFVPVIVYTFYEHSIRGFSQSSANWVMNPFFNDHTSYGACLVMFFPFLIWKLFSKKIKGLKWLLLSALFGLFMMAVVFSYTRAAWVSLLGALGIFIILKFKIKAWVIYSGIFVVGIVALLSWYELFSTLEKNKQDSSSNLTEHVASISNVSSDASNLERLNRWKSAWGMFKDRPVFGYGPGTYAFEYAPYQRVRDKTIISTNSGDGGNAHSEYLGPLSEQGLIGMLLMLGILAGTCVSAVKTYKSKGKNEFRMISFVSFLGLITYYLHGLLNNFLDTDKASSLFWGFTAIIVVMDVLTSRSNAVDLTDKVEK
jgi:putative inorganic carbon (HCO3(-)) transporter